jgi:hypothetical protein
VRSTLDCGSPAAAFPSQPCWRPVQGIYLQSNSSAKAAAVQRWLAPGPCPGSRAASRKRQEACRSPRSLRLGRRCEKHLGVRQPCCRFSQPALLATRSRDMPPTKQLRQSGSGLALARAKPVSRQQGCLQKAAGGLPQSKEPAAREAVREAPWTAAALLPLFPASPAGDPFEGCASNLTAPPTRQRFSVGPRQARVPAAGLPPESGRKPAAVQGACGSC